MKIEQNEREKKMTKCEWFAKCDHDAVATMPGPNLLRIGEWMEIPICQRCHDKVARIMELAND